MRTLSEIRCFGGVQGVYSFDSLETCTEMRFGIFLPPAARFRPVPGLLWLSGLTCTEENFIVKAGAQRIAAHLNIALIISDTSPRGLEIKGDRENYDFGVSAGFYLDAEEDPWSKNYRMYSHITKELVQVTTEHFPIDRERLAISGHSMGGHGAISIGLKNPDLFKSISAFSPISSTMQCPWGQNALSNYLGKESRLWRENDCIALAEDLGWKGPPILVDQGLSDRFIYEQLKPNLLIEACQKFKIPLNFRYQDGYDHSYFFIATFIEDHIKFHYQNLGS